ncbi:MAG: NADH-quinone oxidoreductase subunit C [Thermodesulfobacteria bacterium]|nr:NADH-quinone oxidoreductase subunit C [Thermodesulfobacteriota bacterium]
MSLKEKVESILQSDLVELSEFRGDICVEIPKRKVIEVLTRLKEAGFDYLSDLFGVDNLAYYEKAKKAKKKKGEDEPEEPKRQGPPPPRFEVIYLLLSLSTNERLQVRVRVPEDDLVLPSVTGLWRAANWPEREVFDMFGVRFKGHPNLRRLLMWDEFQDHPLRKDYPLEGKGEERHLNYDIV